MEDLIHALLFIGLAGALFTGLIVADAYYQYRKNSNQQYSFKETISNMTMGASYKIMDGIAVAVVIRLFFDWVHQFGLQYQPGEGFWNIALGIVIIAVVADFGWYWLHRMTHKVRWFWSSHVTHHSSRRFNYATALRQNFTVVFNCAWMFQWVPIALIGFDKNWATIAIELNLLYQFFLHTENKSILDKFGAVLNGPSHHRVHHGSNPEQIDVNFGGVFIIWDKLFGTFVAEKDAGKIEYGITERQPDSLNPLYLQLHEWRDMFADFVKHRDFRVFIKGPGWVTDHYGR